jgi:hypothetical protein
MSPPLCILTSFAPPLLKDLFTTCYSPILPPLDPTLYILLASTNILYSKYLIFSFTCLHRFLYILLMYAIQQLRTSNQSLKCEIARVESMYCLPMKHMQHRGPKNQAETIDTSKIRQSLVSTAY